MASNPRNTRSKKATNPKPSTSKAKRPRTASEPPENAIHFINDQAQEFHKAMKSFEVVGERKFEFTKLVNYPFFEAELRRRGWTKLNEMIDEANNKTVIVEFFANARVSDTPFQSFVRGKTIDFSPEALNEWLNVQPPEECWVEKLRREITDDFNATKQDQGDGIFEGLRTPGAGHSDDDVNMG